MKGHKPKLWTCEKKQLLTLVNGVLIVFNNDKCTTPISLINIINILLLLGEIRYGLYGTLGTVSQHKCKSLPIFITKIYFLETDLSKLCFNCRCVNKKILMWK